MKDKFGYPVQIDGRFSFEILNPKYLRPIEQVRQEEPEEFL